MQLSKRAYHGDVMAPDSLGSVFDTLLAVITRDFGWLYL